MLDAITDPDVENVVFMTSSQVGKSIILMMALGYYMEIDPSPVMLVFPTLSLGQAFSKDRITPMIRDNEGLNTLFTASKRNPDNANMHKRYPGGSLSIVSANSPSDLSSRPIRVVLADEVDRFPLNVGDNAIQEGDPLTLAAKRTNTFWNRKLVYTSTPTVKDISRIEKAYLNSDQRLYMVPCPSCGLYQDLRWEQLRWDKEGDTHLPDTTVYVCEECNAEITHDLKQWMLAQGEWQIQNPDSKVAGFNISELYSPWRSWTEVVESFLEAKAGGIDFIRAFENTSLGRTYEEKGFTVDDGTLFARREAYPDEEKLPEGVLLLTAAVDTQDSWLSMLVVGWGRGEEAWLVERIEINGEPSEDYVWEQLTEHLQRKYETVDGRTLGIEQTCIDAGGHFTSNVYNYVKHNERHIPIVAIIGRAGENRAIVSAPSQKRSGKDRRPVKVYVVGVDAAKTLFYNRLSIEEPGPSYIHIPIKPEMDQGFMAELTAEKRVRSFSKGRPVYKWVQLRDRNEGLDTMCYNYAALALRRPNWDAIEQRNKPQPDKPEETAVQRHKRRVHPRRSNNYATNWKK